MDLRPLRSPTRFLTPLFIAWSFTLGACSPDYGDVPHSLRDPFATTAFDSTRGVTVLFGGLDGSRAGETWEWDGSTWTRRATTGPSPRQGHALAFDSARGVTVLFGGFEGSGHLSGQTWEWDGITWTLRTSTGPTPRYGHAMAFDSVRGTTYLFGGFDGQPNRTQDTWEYVGSSGRWFLRATLGPSKRLRHAMVFDATRNVTLLFGGQDDDRADGAFSSDLWQYEGQFRRWTQINATGPSARYLHAMVFDNARGVALLFGGLTSDYQYAGDTWAWDGVAWTQEPAAVDPAPRAAHAMAFDNGRNVAVLFGGYAGSFNRETWEWDGVQWVEHDAAFSIPSISSLSARGFGLLEGSKGGVRLLEFQLDADANGMRGSWTGSR